MTLKPARVRDIVARFPGRKILVLGDCMLDQWVWGKVCRISPEAPVPVVEVDSYSFTPGGAANVVNNLCALGASSRIVGVVGKDGWGRRLKVLLRERGAEVRGIVTDPSRPTTLKTRIIAHSQQVVRADLESRDELGDGIVSHLLNHAKTCLRDSEAIIISDYAKGVLTVGLVQGILEEAKKLRIPVVVGPKPANIDLFRGVTVIALNQGEAEQASGIAIKDEDALHRAVRDIIARVGCDLLLITRGERGMSFFEKGGSEGHIPALASQVYDVSGAGDTVIAVFTLSLVSGAKPLEAAVLANRAAAIVVKKVGTATLKREELVGRI